MGKWIFLLLAVFPAWAEDLSIERRTANLAHELRCLVCQNQSIAESNAPLAVDLRGQIREQLAAGKSESEVKDYMVARYGDFVLYRPPFNLKTFLLWAGPFLFLLLGLWLLLRTVRNRSRPAGLSEEDRARAAKLLE